MDAKTKAQSLIDKFKTYVTTWDCYNDTARDESHVIEDAKQCALICVQEILATLELSMGIYPIYIITETKYWESVKEEISKI